MKKFLLIFFILSFVVGVHNYSESSKLSTDQLPPMKIVDTDSTL